MKKILNFNSFINESSRYPQSVNLPKNITRQIEGEVGKRALGQFTGDRNFGGMYLQDDPEDPEYRDLYIIWENSTIKVPVYKFRYDGVLVFNRKEIPQLNNLLNSLSPGYRKITDDPSPPFNTISAIFHIIDILIKKSRKESKFFNPFDDVDIYNNDLFKTLEKIGTKIASSDLDKKRGVLVLSNKNLEQNVFIYPNGYIRTKTGNRMYQLTRTPDLIKPIYNEDDLDIKLLFVFFYIMKKVLLKGGLTIKEANQILKAYAKDPKNYDELVKNIVKQKPNLVLYLPPPSDGFSPKLERGVKFLDRFGIFDQPET